VERPIVRYGARIIRRLGCIGSLIRLLICARVTEFLVPWASEAHGLESRVDFVVEELEPAASREPGAEG
jgi:hypothetical protein